MEKNIERRIINCAMKQSEFLLCMQMYIHMLLKTLMNICLESRIKIKKNLKKVMMSPN